MDLLLNNQAVSDRVHRMHPSETNHRSKTELSKSTSMVRNVEWSVSARVIRECEGGQVCEGGQRVQGC